MIETGETIFDVGSKSKDGAYSSFLTEVRTDMGFGVRGNGLPIRGRLVKRSKGGRPWDDIDPAGIVLEMAISSPDKGATDGTFDVTYNGSGAGLSGLAYNITEAAFNTALNANAQIIAAGGVVATKVEHSGGAVSFLIRFNTVGVRPLFGTDETNLFPECQVEAHETFPGTAGAREQQVITISRRAYALQNTWDGLEVGSVSATVKQEGSSTAREVVLIAFNVPPYDGTFLLNFPRPEIVDIACTAGDLAGKYFTLFDKDGTVGVWISDGVAPIPAGAQGTRRQIAVAMLAADSAATKATKLAAALEADAEFTATVINSTVARVTDITGGLRGMALANDSTFTITRAQEGKAISANVPWDAAPEQVVTLTENTFDASKNTDGSFELRALVVGNQPAVTVANNTLKFPTGFAGVINLSTVGMFNAFAESVSDELDLIFEGRITFPGELPYTFYRQAFKVKKAVLDFGALSSTPIAGVSAGGIVQLWRFDGTSVGYPPAVDTDAARGDALRGAIAAAVAGELVEFGPGDFDLGGTVLLVPAGVSVHGKGPLNTFVVSSVAGASNCAVVPPSNAELRGFTITLPVDASLRAPLGARGSQPAFTGAVITDVRLLGGSDGFNIVGASGGPFSARLVGLVCETSYDNFVVNHETSTVTAIGCKFKSSGLSPFADNEWEGNCAVVAAGGCSVLMMNCEIEVVESVSGAAEAVKVATVGTTLELHGCTVDGDGATDMSNSAGTLRVTATRYNTAKTSGTITTV